MGVAQHPENSRRFALSFYSDCIAPDDPLVSQWDHPDIYLADVLFETEDRGRAGADAPASP